MGQTVPTVAQLGQFVPVVTVSRLLGLVLEHLERRLSQPQYVTPPDVWAVFLVHHAEGGSHDYCCKGVSDNVGGVQQFIERTGFQFMLAITWKTNFGNPFA